MFSNKSPERRKRMIETFEVVRKLNTRTPGPFEKKWATRREMWFYCLVSMALSLTGLVILFRHLGLWPVVGLFLYLSGKCFWLYVQCRNE